MNNLFCKTTDDKEQVQATCSLIRKNILLSYSVMVKINEFKLSSCYIMDHLGVQISQHAVARLTIACLCSCSVARW